eukprot:PITA_30953
MQVESRKKWKVAMEEEMESLTHNQTWEFVKLPIGKTTLKNKWVYRLKEEDGGKQRYKVRLVVKGFAQKKVGVVSRYMNNLGKEHWMVVKRILRYLKGTIYQALCFGGSNISLQGYFYADMAGDRDNRRRTTGYVFTVGGTTVSWVSKIQSVVALSTTKAEYVAATKASKEMIWLQRFMGELGKEHDMGTLYNDIQSVIHLAKNSAFHSRTKHI